MASLNMTVQIHYQDRDESSLSEDMQQLIKECIQDSILEMSWTQLYNVEVMVDIKSHQ